MRIPQSASYFLSTLLRVWGMLLEQMRRREISGWIIYLYSYLDKCMLENNLVTDIVSSS